MRLLWSAMLCTSLVAEQMKGWTWVTSVHSESRADDGILSRTWAQLHLLDLDTA